MEIINILKSIDRANQSSTFSQMHIPFWSLQEINLLSQTWLLPTEFSRVWPGQNVQLTNVCVLHHTTSPRRLFEYLGIRHRIGTEDRCPQMIRSQSLVSRTFYVRRLVWSLLQ